MENMRDRLSKEETVESLSRIKVERAQAIIRSRYDESCFTGSLALFRSYYAQPTIKPLLWHKNDVNY